MRAAIAAKLVEPPAAAVAEEKHYTVQEIADLWRVAPVTVWRHFSDMPGVLRLAYPRLANRKRTRQIMRIPASVLQRFYQQHTKGFEKEIRFGGGK